MFQLDKRLVCVAGPCVLEASFDPVEFAKTLKKITDDAGVNFVFKASFDKANRTSVDGFRGPGLREGLAILKTVKEEAGVLICTDVHETHQVEAVAKIADIIQIPAFLCRQTDLIIAAAKTGRYLHIKKGQFCSADQMLPAINKVKAFSDLPIFLGERGNSFGYHNLVVDMRNVIRMRELGAKVLIDGTHCVQLPGFKGDASSGERQFVKYMVRSAMVSGAEGVFLEVHPSPDTARSDRDSQLTPELFAQILLEAQTLFQFYRQHDH